MVLANFDRLKHENIILRHALAEALDGLTFNDRELRDAGHEAASRALAEATLTDEFYERWVEDFASAYRATIDTQHSEMANLRDVLAFYGDAASYVATNGMTAFEGRGTSPIEQDSGKRAREALGGDNDGN